MTDNIFSCEEFNFGMWQFLKLFSNLYQCFNTLLIHASLDDEDAPNAAPSLPVQAVLCLTACPLLPHSSTLHAEDLAAAKPTSLRGTAAQAAPGFCLSSLDARRVLQVLARWQQASPDRAVLLSGVDFAIVFYSLHIYFFLSFMVHLL